MPGETGPTLDDEGVPDLQGPLPAKEETGDPQEGVTPPGDRPRAAVDWGVTSEEQRRGEPLDARVGREQADIDDSDQDRVAADLEPMPDRAGGELVGDDVLADDEAESVAAEVEGDPQAGRSAEEVAVHVVADEDVGTART